MLESLSGDELQFIKAIEKYKQENSKLFLSWTEVLKIVRELGYRKVSAKELEKEARNAPKKRSSSKAKTKA